MRQRSVHHCGLVLLLLCTLPHVPAFGVGAVLYKSGPIQITQDGQYVWLVNPDHDSVSRIRTSDDAVIQFALPAIGERHNPRGVAISANGGEVWVVTHDSNRVYVLDGGSGAVLDSIGLPYGSGPISVALSPDGGQAVVALHRSAQVAVIDTATRTVTGYVDEMFRRPFGLAYPTAGSEVWVTHTVMDGEDSHLSAIDTGTLSITAQVILKSVNPKEHNQISGDPDPVPEGGYLLVHGHPAKPPGLNQVWFPVQYQNFHNDLFTPDSTVQAALHRIDLATKTHMNNTRVVLTAVYAHNNTTLLGPGWNAGISGPIDLAFNAAGSTAYLVNAYSNDVLVFAANIGMSKPGGANPLTEIPVGSNPLGIVASPTADRLYVMNYLSRDVSVINTTTSTEIARVAATPGTSEPLDPLFLQGAKIFNTSDDARVSSNDKMSCASCHPNGENEGLAWDFAQLGAGHRKTLHLRGLNLSFAPQANGRGQLHRSGDRDEVQDFDFTFRAPTMGGTGFAPALNPPLGAPNAGLDADLDALAFYLLNLPANEKSPYRDTDGSLTPAAKRGAAIYKNNSGGPYDVGCGDCHPAPNFTDLGFHDIGGQAPDPENEGPLFNTPSLVGAWDFAPYTQAVGWPDGSSLGGVARSAKYGVHGDTAGLNRAQLRDLEAFLNSIDGDMAQTGIAAVADTDPPRIVAIRPVSIDAVDVIFDETVDPTTAGDPANYVLDNGFHEIAATLATVSGEWGNRVRLAVALEYYGCGMTYTLRPGPIEDVAGDVAGGPNNVLDVDDPANFASFDLDGAITVTFGDTGTETFNGVAKDAGIIAGLTSWSHARWWLYPYTSPEMKGFVAFDFVPTLVNECGVADSADILDARFSAVPNLGHRTTLEIRRCFMPWGEPPNDWCNNCAGAVTVNHATHPSIPWHQSGARALGGGGVNVSEYYPTAAFDAAATTDATAQVGGIGKRVEFSGGSVTSAFRFWFDHPTANYGYSVEVVGNNNVGTEFWGADQEDGKHGHVLSVTFAVVPNSSASDCNANGAPDPCDIADGTLSDVNDNDVADECENPSAPPSVTSEPGGVNKNRFVSFRVPPSGTAAQTALRVRLTSLHHPAEPPDAPDFTAFEGEYRFVAPIAFDSQTGEPIFDCPDSDTYGTAFKCAVLSCQPTYLDWSAYLGGFTVHVTGDAVVPSSTYHVSHLGSACQGNETGCTEASFELALSTSQWGDVLPGTLDVLDVSAQTDKVKELLTAPPEVQSLLGGPQGVDPLTEAVDVVDISNTVDALKGFAYPFMIAACD